MLFRASRRDVDSDFRFGYRFTHWVLPRLPPELQAEAREAFKPVLSASNAGAVKGPQEPKLHAQDTELTDELPRPRLPKSLRQL